MCGLVFMQSLDGQARKWFKELHVGSIAGIKALDDIFETLDSREFINTSENFRV